MEDKHTLKEFVSRCEKVGFKSMPKEDFQGLTKLFNKFIEEIYDAILFYLNEDTLNVVYPVIYDYLSRVLVISIAKETKIDKFNQIFHLEAEKILTQTFNDYNIDVFKQEYILSSLDLDDVSRVMVNNFICSVIANSFNKKTAIIRREFICDKLNISRFEYLKRLFIISRQINKLLKKEDIKYTLNK